MAAAWASGTAPTDRLVLLALADWACPDGECWPSVPRLAARTGVHERTVRAAIGRLEAGGHLTRRVRVGRGVTYRLTPGGASGVNAATTPGAEPATPGAAPANTSVIRQRGKKASPSTSTRTNPYPMPHGVGIDPGDWRDFLSNRKRRRLANTAAAHRQLVNDLAREQSTDWTAAALLAHAAGKGWGSVHNPDREDNRHGRSTSTARATQRRPGAPSLTDMLIAADAAIAAEHAASADAEGGDGAGPALSHRP